MLRRPKGGGMFVQVVQGRVKDPEKVKEMRQKWLRDLAPGAEGWLGSTSGIGDDNEFIAVVRFDSEEAARRNSNRPEQDRWWSEFSQNLDGEAAFYDCTEVDFFLDGGSDDAGFVQIIQGYVEDKERLREVSKEFETRLVAERPEIIGGITAWGPNNGFTDAVYFTSEAEARKGESKELPEDLRGLFDEWEKLVPDRKFIDLHDPWLDSPSR